MLAQELRENRLQSKEEAKARLTYLVEEIPLEDWEHGYHGDNPPTSPAPGAGASSLPGAETLPG